MYVCGGPARRRGGGTPDPLLLLFYFLSLGPNKVFPTPCPPCHDPITGTSTVLPYFQVAKPFGIQVNLCSGGVCGELDANPRRTCSKKHQ